MRTYRVARRTFRLVFENAREISWRVADATSPGLPESHAAVFYLTDDMRSGYVVTRGELTNLFSLVKGRGHGLVDEAVLDGATHLDCFDGYLPDLYAAHGFVETHREPNWTPGGPDVVYMTLGV